MSQPLTIPATCHLDAHPAHPCPVPLRLSVSLAPRLHAGAPGIGLRYVLAGDCVRVRMPAPVSGPGPADGLWQHTCFEAFVALEGAAAYREFNFSPSGQWAAYRFSQERVRDLPAEQQAGPARPAMDITTLRRRWTLDVHLPLDTLPGDAGDVRCWGLSAVIETTDGHLSHWALHHPAPRPDFHHPAGRTLRLPAHAA